jgi:hypothetical protein
MYLKRKMLGRVQWFMPVIPATLEAEIRRTWLEASPGKKVSETPSQATNQVGCYTPVILATRKV